MKSKKLHTRKDLWRVRGLIKKRVDGEEALEDSMRCNWRVAPAHHNERKHACSNKDQAQPKMNLKLPSPGEGN